MGNLKPVYTNLVNEISRNNSAREVSAVIEAAQNKDYENNVLRGYNGKEYQVFTSAKDIVDYKMKEFNSNDIKPKKRLETLVEEFVRKEFPELEKKNSF